MGIPGGRIIKAQELIRCEKRQSRKESRANLVNAKRNIVFKTAQVEAPALSEAEKLKLWRIEKKKRMEEEKLKRRPPFLSYIIVKHTGLSPYKSTYPSTLNPIRKMKKTDRVTNNSATSRTPSKQVPTSSKQNTENNGQTIMARRVTRQTVINNGLSTKQEPNKFIVEAQTTLPPRNTRSTKKQTTNPPAPKTIREVESKPLRIVQPSNKIIKSTITTKKTDKEVKPLNNRENRGRNIKTVNTNKKEIKKKTALKENKENISALNAQNNKIVSTSKKSAYFTRSSTKIAASTSVPVVTPTGSSNNTVSSSSSSSSSSSPSSSSNTSSPANGPEFQRARLLEETSKLQALKDKWTYKEKEDNHIPDNVRDEILSVTGLTTLLVTSKFEQFKSLIDDCSLQMKNPDMPQRILPDDLDGFWEMMYLQVVQLHNKYANLEKLMQNNWQEKNIRSNNCKTKKSIIKTPIPGKSGPSRFQDFLNKKKENDITMENKSSSGLATPKAVENLITAQRSRRSSMNIIMGMSGVGKFDVSGTKVEKGVWFADD